MSKGLGINLMMETFVSFEPKKDTEEFLTKKG
jgi:hypothetical protein